MEYPIVVICMRTNCSWDNTYDVFPVIKKYTIDNLGNQGIAYIILLLTKPPYSSSSTCGVSKCINVACGWIPAERNQKHHFKQ